MQMAYERWTIEDNTVVDDITFVLIFLNQWIYILFYEYVKILSYTPSWSTEQTNAEGVL